MKWPARAGKQCKNWLDRSLLDAPSDQMLPSWPVVPSLMYLVCCVWSNADDPFKCSPTQIVVWVSPMGQLHGTRDQCRLIIEDLNEKYMPCRPMQTLNFE